LTLNPKPQVVVIDEIGTEAECSAARTIAQRGVQLFATAHGNELENVVKNPALSDLVGGIQSVTLGGWTTPPLARGGAGCMMGAAGLGGGSRGGSAEGAGAQRVFTRRQQ
jgi:hypothetical protein